MGFSKTEVNLRRLLAAAPQQQNQAKLVHYVATLREQLEQLAEERSPGGLPRVSKAQLNEYSEKIEAIAAKLVVTESSTQISEEPALETKVRESPSISEEESISSPRGLRRRLVKLQEDLTDEMVDLARQLKESSIIMNQSIKNTENILDSTEKAVEHSLASTGHANSRAMEVYSQKFNHGTQVEAPNPAPLSD
ncbi:hypothetical protein DH2020_001370 [Rehmannia glutinosa]|uniref:Uncharacterized protein n=1 Tax=Rehmannia glutinosa TaxID=99300 RepID=A0ABR0XZK7_REHGL